MHIFQPRSSRILAAVTGALCLIGAVLAFVYDGWPKALYTIPWLTLVAWCAWAMFWAPAVAVDDSGIQLRNVLRTITIRWPAVQAIDTRWSLAIKTGTGTYHAWAAPAPGRTRVRPLTKGETTSMPRSAWVAKDVIGYGDLPSSLSGSAAALVRAKFDELTEAGHLDNPKPEHPAPLMRWHLPQLVSGALLIAACISTVLS